MIDRALAIGLAVMLALAMPAAAQTWTPLVNQPTFSASTALLLTDGTVMVQASESGIWWRLTPDSGGSYVNGTWSQLASMPAGYGPLYYASAVLPDGRVIVEGGEYNISGSGVWTTLGAIYDPVSNSWASVAPPAGWGTIGDAQGVVLANGTFMLANCCNTQQALLNASTLTWTATGTGKAEENDEEGWTLLPNQKVLTVDANNPGNLTNSEIYNPATGSWSSAGSTIVKLPDTNSDGSGSHELGPAVLRPDGTVFASGGTSNTAIYNASSGAWSAGPTFPSGIDVADGPAALLPNGNVLVDASPGVFNAPSQFFEFNGTTLISVPAAAGASSAPSYVGRMLVLPTGQILLTGLSSVQVYTASGTYQSAWQPAVTSVAANLSVGSLNNAISGTQFNGLSQGSAYGDDAQSATNYPLVRITNNATGHVFYARTHDHSTMAVATGSATVSTKFDVPAGIETGASILRVVANGIPSNGVPVQITGGVLLADDFNTASLDTSKWKNAIFTGSQNTSVPVSDTSGQLQIGPLPTNATSSSYNGITSLNKYDFTGVSAYVQLVQAAVSNSNAFTMFAVGNDVNNFYRFYVSGGSLVCEKKIGGAKSQLGSVAYDAVLHQFLQIRHDAATGNVVYETAPNNGGVPGSWTQQCSEPWNTTAIPVTSVQFEMKAGTSVTETNPPGTIIFDNFRAQKSSLLTDNFNTTTLDTTKWSNTVFTGSQNTSVPVSDTSGQLQIGPLPTNATSSSYNGITSLNRYDFTGAFAYVQLVQPAASNSNAFTMFAVGNDGNNFYRFYVSGGSLVCEKKIGGAKSQLGSVAYDAIQHQFLQIRHDTSTGNVAYETAPNNGGVPGSWTQQCSEPWNTTAIPVTLVQFEMKAGTSVTESNPPGTVIFDNFNAAK